MFRGFLNVFLICAGALLLLEVSVRYLYYGTAGLSATKMNSMVHIWQSGFTQAADDPAVWFELRPDVNGWFRGARFRTNSAGLPDDEYAIAKPPETFRIAVVGSSWTMPSGIPLEEAWHAVLEERLGADLDGQRVEVISFGVEHYGLREIAATVRSKVLAYDPDLILFGTTLYTAKVEWTEPEATRFEPLPVSHPFQQSLILRLLNLNLNLGLMPTTEHTRPMVTDHDDALAQLERAMGEVEAAVGGLDTPVALVFLGHVPLGDKLNAGFEKAAGSRGFAYIDTSGPQKKYGIRGTELVISRMDNHPNKQGHELLADQVYLGLKDNDLVPVN